MMKVYMTAVNFLEYEEEGQYYEEETPNGAVCEIFDSEDELYKFINDESEPSILNHGGFWTGEYWSNGSRWEFTAVRKEFGA